MTPHPPLVIGLIGTIGAGKSAAARILAAHGGAAVIDADRVGHDVLELHDVKSQLTARWDSILDDNGHIDRRAVAKIVFNDPQEKAFLESVVFPVIRRECERRIDTIRAEGTAEMIVLDAPVLLEAGWRDIADVLLFIDAPRALREERVRARNGWTPADLAAREAAQWPIDYKQTFADAVIVNESTMEELEAKVRRFIATHVKERL